MPLATLIDYLDDHAGASTVILTAALVAITAFYAWQNRNMVSEMKKARDATVLPKLALDFHRLGPTAMTLAVKNVGPGAALEVDVRMSWQPRAGGEAPERRWRRSILAPGEQSDFMPPGETVNDSLNFLPATYKSVQLTGRMRDAVGNEHAVEESIEDLAEWRQLLGQAHERWVEADPERRMADAFYRKFEQLLRGLRGK